MHGSRTPRRAVRPMLGRVRHVALAGATALTVAVSLAPAASAAPAPATSERDVRVVVRTTGRAAADVVEAAERRGARAAGRIGRLRAVAFDVPAGQAERVRRALLRRADVRTVEVAHRRWLTEEPADPRFGQQKTYLDAIRATSAWGRPAHGAPDVRIAVIDSGVDVRHPDLAGKVVGTFNAITRSGDVRDLVGHGTGVASVAAAATNNGQGLAGAGYDSSLLVAKVADRTGRIFTDDLAAGIVWAVDSGADVINLSLGGPTSDQLERDAVAYARRAGVLVVAAAGNDGTRTEQFPGALPDVLAVGATNANGSARAPFSSFGSWVDVAAPGRGIVVAAPGGGYETADGTSFASPLVAGQVALLEAYRPGRSSAELADAVVSGANSAKLGFARGLVDFAASLDLLPPASTPALTAPAAGATVRDTATVSVSTTAPRVRLTLADQARTVAAQDGVASASFETYGLAGAQPVTATDCSRIDQCAATAASSTVTVANAAPSLTAPAPGTAADADTLRAAAEAAGGAVRFLVDGTHRVTDRSAPYEAQLSTEGLADGQHTVAAVLCRADGAVCDTGNASVASVSVTRLHPTITKARTRLSPGRDGRQDTTTVRYSLDRPQVVTFRVRRADGTVVLARRLGRRAAGESSVRWDGRGGNRRLVRSGSYTVEISTRQPDGSLVGLATRSVVVDRSAPRTRAVKVSSSTLYPAKDRYRDTVTMTGTVSERHRRVWLEVRSRSGALVASRRAGRGDVGVRTLTWDGGTGGGRTVRPGAYRLRLVVEDLAGNRRASAARTVTVSGQRLVRRVGRMTVTARASLQESFADECSLVFRHTEGKRKDWVGYYSGGTCSSADAYAVGDHQVRLPKAARYGWVQVSVYGGKADARFRDAARVTYYDRYQNLGQKSFRLAPALGTHTGLKVSARQHLFRTRVLRWATTTTGVAWYDVERYSVRFSYYVLR